MFKLIVTAAIVTLLSACSSMSGGSMSDSSGMSRSGSMGSSGSMNDGTGPRGSSAGGPN